MTIEEKAKAYDEALKKAKDMLSYKEVRQEDIEYLFPALKESEDERIRKEIIIYLKSILSNKKYGDKFIEDWIAWLEKQVPACLSHDDEIMIRQLTEYFTTGKGLQNTNDTVAEWLTDVKRKLEKQGKNNMGISETTKQKLEDNLNKALEKETPESLSKFFDEQKPAWSEEDERKLELLKALIEDAKGNSTSYSTMFREMEELNNWLKSLKERYTWKPSDEQMDAINDAIDYLGGNTKIVRKHLMSLYDQLKKLKG